jgi:mannose-1-phosphate guanylyltransferase
MIALIMAGGVGARFWPASTRSFPKQFLPILGDKSMIRVTFERLLPLIQPQDIYVVTTADQVHLVQEHLKEMPEENIIVEPAGMNTAPCLALSLVYLERRYPKDTPMLVLPADHYIRDTESFLQSLKVAKEVAGKGLLVTFGIKPSYPATGYGYIQAGEELEPGVQEVLKFKEKPKLQTAISFLKKGNFYWNSGMFCWTILAIKEAFEDYLPKALYLAETITDAREWGSGARADELYFQMPKKPIDIAIMEKAANRAVIPVDYGWSDVGSWEALANLSAKDEDGNSFKSGGVGLNSKDNYVQTSKFTALIDVENLCIVEGKDAFLICPKKSSESVRQLVDLLKKEKHDELL